MHLSRGKRRRSTAKRGRALLAAGLLAFVALALAGPSYAHDVRAYHPGDPSWLATLHSRGHEWLAVCDNHADGHQTYGRYELLLNGSTWKPNYSLTGHDSFGNNASGDFCNWEGHQGVYRDIAVCVQYEGCGGWVTVYRSG
jgi:hypothetical protein